MSLRTANSWVGMLRFRATSLRLNVKISMPSPDKSMPLRHDKMLRCMRGQPTWQCHCLLTTLVCDTTCMRYVDNVAPRHDAAQCACMHVCMWLHACNCRGSAHLKRAAETALVA